MLKRTLAVTTAAASLVAFLPGIAQAAVPRALPAAHSVAEGKWQPVFDYDTDGCYSTPAIGRDGSINPGLDTKGGLSEGCRDASDLANTNTYSRAKCDPSGWCAYLYDLYFEKDQVLPGWDPFGHRHDIEHVVVWVYRDQARYVSTSEHGGYDIHKAADVAWQGTHAKIVYHKDGATTHCFRLGWDDEEPENHRGTWQRPPLVGWNHWPSSSLRNKLTGHDFGSANQGINTESFAGNLDEAKPSGVRFDAFR